MLQELVPNFSETNGMFTKSGSNINASPNIRLSTADPSDAWPSNFVKCTNKYSPIQLPEISEFLSEQSSKLITSQRPVCESFVKLLEEDEQFDKRPILDETDRFLNLKQEHEADKSNAKRPCDNKFFTLPRNSPNQKKRKQNDNSKPFKDTWFIDGQKVSFSGHAIPNESQFNELESLNEQAKRDDFSYLSQQQLGIIFPNPDVFETKLSIQNGYVGHSPFSNLLLDSNNTDITNAFQSTLCTTTKVENEIKGYPVVSRTENVKDNLNLCSNQNRTLISTVANTECFPLSDSLTSNCYNVCSNLELPYPPKSSLDEARNPARNSNYVHQPTNSQPTHTRNYSLSNSQAESFGEVTWKDARNQIQYNGSGMLHLASSNTLLEDLDLTDVDSACMERFERRCEQEAVKETELACTVLKIPTDAEKWTEHHVDKWIMWTVHQCNLPVFDISALRMSGSELCKLGEAEMLSRVPTCGDIIHGRLNVWKSASKIIEAHDKTKTNESCTTLHQSQGNTIASKKTQLSNEKVSENSVVPTSTNHSFPLKSQQTSSIHLWMFLKELLLQPQLYGQFIRWINKDEGVFKIEDSMEVARLWGVRKNRPAMNYDKLSRSIRQYYKKGIIKKTPVSQRLVYQFVNPALSMPI